MDSCYEFHRGISPVEARSARAGIRRTTSIPAIERIPPRASPGCRARGAHELDGLGLNLDRDGLQLRPVAYLGSQAWAGVRQAHRQPGSPRVCLHACVSTPSSDIFHTTARRYPGLQSSCIRLAPTRDVAIKTITTHYHLPATTHIQYLKRQLFSRRGGLLSAAPFAAT